MLLRAHTQIILMIIFLTIRACCLQIPEDKGVMTVASPLALALARAEENSKLIRPPAIMKVIGSTELGTCALFCSCCVCFGVIVLAG